MVEFANLKSKVQEELNVIAEGSTTLETTKEEFVAEEGELDYDPLIDFEIIYDTVEFEKGVKQGSYVAGFYSALVAAGVPATEAISVATSRMMMEYNLKLGTVQETQLIVDAL